MVSSADVAERFIHHMNGPRPTTARVSPRPTRAVGRCSRARTRQGHTRAQEPQAQGRTPGGELRAPLREEDLLPRSPQPGAPVPRRRVRSWRIRPRCPSGPRRPACGLASRQPFPEPPWLPPRARRRRAGAEAALVRAGARRPRRVARDPQPRRVGSHRRPAPSRRPSAFRPGRASPSRRPSALRRPRRTDRASPFRPRCPSAAGRPSAS